jgi:hypothetical protein|tara:strand:- start:1798 stop:1953 length:156 start_codon:yes stop_codon:yes gene_type:complete
MKTYYVYKTVTGTLKLSDGYVAGHVLKISAKSERSAKTALTKYKKLLKDGE